MQITIFGGSSPKPGEEPYIIAERLGYELGAKGHTVLTGGYIGTMEAVSKGASSAGGHVIGVTCEEIERWRTVKPNKWVKEERRYFKLHERILALINDCDIALALPGGVGTLTEIALMWNLSLIGSITPKLIILIGKSWKGIVSSFLFVQSPYIKDRDNEMITMVNDIDSALKIINDHKDQ